MGPTAIGFPRDIVAGVIDLCLRTPQSVSSRLLLVQLLLAMAHTRPDVVQERGQIRPADPDERRELVGVATGETAVEVRSR